MTLFPAGKGFNLSIHTKRAEDDDMNLEAERRKVIMTQISIRRKTIICPVGISTQECQQSLSKTTSASYAYYSTSENMDILGQNLQ